MALTPTATTQYRLGTDVVKSEPVTVTVMPLVKMRAATDGIRLRRLVAPGATWHHRAGAATFCSTAGSRSPALGPTRPAAGGDRQRCAPGRTGRACLRATASPPATSAVLADRRRAVKTVSSQPPPSRSHLPGRRAGGRYAIGLEHGAPRTPSRPGSKPRRAGRSRGSRPFALVANAPVASSTPGVSYVEHLERDRVLAFTPNDPMLETPVVRLGDPRVRRVADVAGRPTLGTVKVAIIDSGSTPPTRSSPTASTTRRASSLTRRTRARTRSGTAPSSPA